MDRQLGVEAETPPLQWYCRNLKELVDGSQLSILKLLSDNIDGNIRGKFKNGWSDEVSSKVDAIVGNLVHAYPLVEHLAQHLKKRMNADFADKPTDDDISIPADKLYLNEANNKLQKYVGARVPASLVLGRYSNNSYPGIDPYIPNNNVKVSKMDVLDVYSRANVLQEVVNGVKSCPFFAG